MRILSFFTLSFLLACATDVPTSNLAKVKPPFLKRYKSRTKELLYIVVEDERTMKPETRALIAQNVKKFDPEIAITMMSPERPQENTLDHNACELNEKDCTPVAWTCRFVKPHGIPCIGGYSYNTEVLEESVRRKLSSDDVLFFHVYKSLLEEFKTNKKPLDKLTQFIEQNKTRINMVSTMDKERFLFRWRDMMGSRDVILTEKNLKPVTNGNYLQNIAKVLRDSGEALTIQKIRKEQLAHERVLVVYTYEHFKHHLAPLEKFFSTELP